MTHPNYLTMIHIADIHFGSVDPIAVHNILETQFLQPISRLTFDILAIDGDLFDRRFSANHPAISAAIDFVGKCAMMCKIRNATLVLLSGTESHDAGQLSLFYNLQSTTGCDVKIIEQTQFIETYGMKILCIPEEYGKGSEYYRQFLNQVYDLCFMHGTLVGGIPGATEENLDSKREPIFSIHSFDGCKGPIIAGHVHTAMCLQKDMYYLSSPIRWRFGEEQDKGFAIVLLDRNTYRYSYNFIPIQSFRYDTISIEDLTSNDPNEIINQLNMMIANGIDHVRLNCKGLKDYQVAVLSKYVREHSNSNIKLFNTSIGMSSNGEIISNEPSQEEVNKLNDLKFLMDDRIDSITKFVMYLNYNKGDSYMTIERLKKLLSDS